jgi:hypothetical protein
MSTYGNDLIKWRVGFIVRIDRTKYPNGYPYGFFGLWGDFAIQYDFTEIK